MAAVRRAAQLFSPALRLRHDLDSLLRECLARRMSKLALSNASACYSSCWCKSSLPKPRTLPTAPSSPLPPRAPMLAHTTGEGMRIVVQVRLGVSDGVRGVAGEVVKCGFGSEAIGVKAGNKGGVAVRLTLFGFSLCVINSHLPAGQSHPEERNATYCEVFAS